MNRNARSKNPSPEDGGMRPAVKWVVMGILLFCVAGLIWHFRGRSPEPSVQVAGGEASQSNASTIKPTAARPVPPPSSTSSSSSSFSTSSSSSPPPPPTVPPVPVDPSTAALVAGLKQLSGTNAVLTADAAAAWRTNFMQLVQNGPASIPALRAFLDEKTDYTFSRDTWAALGYSSARVAAIDALRQIGGPDAVAAMEGLLGTTQSPREVALLARNLEDSSPGQYREQALSAARTALQAALRSRDPQLDVAPLFEVFQRYGDASAVGELEQAMGQWKYYSTIALANLPDGAGVPSILRMADPASSSGNRVVALEMVAQLAASNPAAREALINQVRANQIPPNLWPYLTSPLAGDQYFPVDSAITLYPQLQSWSDLRTTRINSGNQNLYMLPGYQSLTPEVIEQRVALVDELLRATSDPAAQRTLTQAREMLSRRYTRSVSQPPPGTGQ